jgi:delta1-piperideine-2-carboxylate reductase
LDVPLRDDVTLSLDDIYELACDVLISNGFSEAHSASIARVIWRCQRDECQSHGLYRLLVCVRTLRAGKVSPDVVPTISHPSSAILRADARGGYSLLSFDIGLPSLVEKALDTGIAAFVINRCCHFSALWPEVEDVARHGLAALCMLPSHSFVAPAGGTKPVLGTNPIAFAWPRSEGLPYVFDFATSAVARGEIELHRRTNTAIPTGWALDESGKPTTEPAAALAGSMLTFGGHKGSALSTMIELLAGPMIGDLLSLEARRRDAGVDGSPYHGELIIAFDPKRFAPGNFEKHAGRAEALFAAITTQGARLPSQRRYEARARSIANGGTAIPRALYDEIVTLRRW